MNDKRRTISRDLFFKMISMLVILGMLLSVGNFASPGVAYATGDQPPTPAPPADSPSTVGSAAGDPGVSSTLVPTPLAPGGTISVTTPTFTWTRVTGATQYQFYVSKGTILQYYKTVSTTACGTSATSCSNTPTNVLSYVVYTWKVRAYVGGAWRALSASKSFTVTSFPNPLSPSGKISDTTPTFIWTRVSGATQYRYQLYNWATWAYTRTVASSFCGPTICSNTPTAVLPFSTAYKWRVQALVGGVWRSYSGWKTFIYPRFNTQFNGSAPGWLAQWGTWSIFGSSYFGSTGLGAGTYSSTSYATKFADFDFSARVKRTDPGVSSLTGLIVRGTPGSYGATNHFWENAYYFAYSKYGHFAVMKNVGGILEFLTLGWMDITSPSEPSYPFNPAGWNTLRVKAVGNFFQFYINGNLVWNGTDPDNSFSSGKVGFIFLNDLAPGNEFLVDYATLNVIGVFSAGSASTDSVMDPAQAAANQAASKNPGRVPYDTP